MSQVTSSFDSLLASNSAATRPAGQSSLRREAPNRSRNCHDGFRGGCLSRWHGRCLFLDYRRERPLRFRIIIWRQLL